MRTLTNPILYYWILCKIMDDYQLIQEILLGKNEKFNELMEKYEKEILVFIKRMVFYNLELTKDIFQEVLIHVFNHLSHYRNTGSFKAWLYTVSANVMKNYFKKNSNYSSKILLNDNLINQIEDSDNIEVSMIRKELLEKTVNIINSLKPKYQLILKMRIFEDLKFREIAERMNESERNIKYIIKKAFIIMKKELKKQGYTDIEV